MFAFPAFAQNPVGSADLAKLRARVIRHALAQAEPAIVTIETLGGTQPIAKVDPLAPQPQPRPPRKGGRPRPQGPSEEGFRLAEGPTTGLIVSPDGLILTSSFNFARNPTVITVTLADGRRFVAKLLGVDSIRRLAMIRIEATGLPTREWTDPAELRVGEYAVACGRGLGGDRPSVSLGILSALGRRNGNAVQTDAKTSPVNYGGPLIDLEGRVIGLIVPMAGAGGALAGAEWYDGGIGFAVTQDRIDRVRDRLAAGESIEAGKIGIVLEPDTSGLFGMFQELMPGGSGVKVKQVAGKSPAAESGVEIGDRIIALDGASIADLMELQRRLSDREAGETITLTVKRRGKKIDIELTLARPSEIGGLEAEEPPEPDEEEEGPTSRPDSD